MSKPLLFHVLLQQRGAFFKDPCPSRAVIMFWFKGRAVFLCRFPIIIPPSWFPELNAMVIRFAIQFASALGATVIATSSSDEKLKVAKKLGAAHTINYKTNPAWEDEVLMIVRLFFDVRIVSRIHRDNYAFSQTGGKGADHVLEVGGVATLLQSIKATRYAGWIHNIGFLSGFVRSMPLLTISGILTRVLYF